MMLYYKHFSPLYLLFYRIGNYALSVACLAPVYSSGEHRGGTLQGAHEQALNKCIFLLK